MSDSPPTFANRAVFVSYAREDTASAQRITEALRSHGVEVWFDQAELRGGDAWDQKIRKQINDCTLFLPIISQNTQARGKGYFRLEWKLAVEQTHLMAEGIAFLAPVVVDDTAESVAVVPPEFLKVQWTRLSGGLATTQFIDQIKHLLNASLPAGVTSPPMPMRSAPVAPIATPVAPATQSRFPIAIVAALGVAVLALVAYVALRPATKEIPAAVSAKPAVAETKPALVASAPAAPAPSPDDKAVAVLPFKNLSGDKEQEYFSDGLTEEILNSLARERDLRVPGVTSSFSFKGKNATATEIAKALGVSRLVEGSVQRSGTRVRIRVALTRAADGFSEELGTFTEETADIFAVYDKIARAVVEKVARRAATRSVAVLTKNAEAYDAYLQGRAIAARSNSNFTQAAAHYERAVELDPAFALAWSGLAVSRFTPYTGAQDRSPEVAAASRIAIDRALALQPDLPEALAARANWERHVNGDYAAASRDLTRAETLQPPTAELRILQTWLERDLGNWDEAYRHARETMELDPRNGGNAFSLALSLYAERGDYLKADQLAAQAIAISGVRDSQSFLPAHLRYLWRGPEAALRLLERTPERYTEFERGSLLLALGRIEEVRASIDASEKNGNFQRRLDAAVRDRNPEIALMLQIGIKRPEAARRAAEQMRAAAQQEMARGNRAPAVRNALICAEVVLDHRAAALAALADWRQEVQKWPNAFQRIANFNWRAAKLHGSLAQADEAVALLQEYFAAGLQPPLNLRFDPSFAPIRQDPRFLKLIAQQAAWTKAQPDPVDP